MACIHSGAVPLLRAPNAYAYCDKHYWIFQSVHPSSGDKYGNPATVYAKSAILPVLQECIGFGLKSKGLITTNLIFIRGETG